MRQVLVQETINIAIFILIHTIPLDDMPSDEKRY